MTTEYYAYILAPDGHIQNRVVVLGEDDEEAKRLAQKLVDGHDVELWQGARRVAAFKVEA